MGSVRVSQQPYERGTVTCPVPSCMAVKDEPCREPRAHGMGGGRYRYEMHVERKELEQGLPPGSLPREKKKTARRRRARRG